MDRYDPQAIEPKWQQVWEAEQAFAGHERADPAEVVRARAAARTRRGRCTWGTCSSTRSATCRRTSGGGSGAHVLHPMGFDSFGLPAENAAIREGGHPREIVERNIASIRRSMHRIGWAIDWSRELSTHDPRYYRWQQWLFLKFLERGHRVPQGRARQVVPERPDGARERAGAARRTLRALRRARRVAADGAVVLPDHRLRADAARRPRDAGLAGVDQGAPAQLDRTLGRRRDLVRLEELGVSTCRCSPRGRTRCSARPSSCSRPSTSSSSNWRRAPRTATRFARTCSAPR